MYHPEADTAFYEECCAGLLLLVKEMNVRVSPLTQAERESVPALLYQRERSLTLFEVSKSVEF
ncbi:hypothetical protein QA648_36160 (plasmid) [Rhizobium sp. CB3171]|uniref:hypothetical protein n=1 Tax=Rhizobium sp. CB3171 TaxID=3039157 RepID=UPI0024B076D5|nr:hypothetical protein [Rhizobium sp. CB3171]WFU07319.1 hypothetical protein QA648_36160 [Rhizobium sp. CB3171]